MINKKEFLTWCKNVCKQLGSRGIFWVAVKSVFSMMLAGTEYIITISAVADVVMIMMACTTILVISVFLAVAGAIYYQSRTRGIAPIRQIQVLFWRVESFIIRIYNTVSDISPKIASPFISIGGRLAFIKSLFYGVPRIFKRG